MDYNTELRFQKLIQELKPRFDMDLDLTALIYLIGVNEVGFGFRSYTKQEKMDLMHVAICTLLSPAGYYEFSHRDDQNWPHFTLLQPLPTLNDGNCDGVHKLTRAKSVFLDPEHELFPRNIPSPLRSNEMDDRI